MNQIKSAVNHPEHLAQYIDIAIELYSKKTDGARFQLDELSFGEWACLAGMREGLDRAREEKAAARHAEDQQRLEAMMRGR